MVERNNRRASDSYKRTADSLAGLRNAIVALRAFVGLAKVRQGIDAVIDTGERLDDLAKEFNNVFGSVAKGSEALEQIRVIAKDVPQGIEDVAAAAIAMRKAGLDPLDGSLQALLDNQNAVNQSQGDLISTISALGKANVRGEATGADTRCVNSELRPRSRRRSRTGMAAEETGRSQSSTSHRTSSC